MKYEERSQIYPQTKKIQIKKIYSGFTLIELIASVGILGIMMSIGIASYANFNNNQRVKQAALTLKNNLRYAQTNASSAKKTTDCIGKMLGYQVIFTTVQSYSIVALCDGGAANLSRVNVILPSDISFTPLPSPNIIMFKVLNRGVSISGPSDYILTGAAKSYSLRVYPGGDIVDLGFSP